MASEPTLAPIDYLLKLTRLMHASAALHDWPRMRRLSVRREQLASRLNAIEAEQRHKLEQIRCLDEDIRKQVAAALASVEQRWKQLRYSHQAMDLYHSNNRI